MQVYTTTRSCFCSPSGNTGFTYAQGLTTTADDGRCPHCGYYSNTILIRHLPVEEKVVEEAPRVPKVWERAAAIVPRFKNLRSLPFRLQQQRARDGLR